MRLSTAVAAMSLVSGAMADAWGGAFPPALAPTQLSV